ncbi:hypothetical protein D3C77_651530 [compost metagenome]
MTVFDHPYFHFVDSAGQRTCIERLQTARHLLTVDQHTVAIDFHHRLAVGGHRNGIDTGVGVVDRQAVGTAVHQAHYRVGTSPDGAHRPSQTLGTGREIPGTNEVALQFPLGMQLMDSMLDARIGS